MRISIGHQFRDTNTKTVYTIVGTGLRNSYTLAIDGKSCGSIPRSMLLFNIGNGTMEYCGSVRIQKPNQIVMSNLLIEGA